jgi:hypothetical protein
MHLEAPSTRRGRHGLHPGGPAVDYAYGLRGVPAKLGMASLVECSIGIAFGRHVDDERDVAAVVVGLARGDFTPLSSPPFLSSPPSKDAY